MHGPKKLCDLCPESFSSGQNLYRHRKQVHKLWQDQEQCEDCKKILKRKENLEHHKASCKGITPESLRKSKRKRERETCECSVCEKTFKSRSSLQRHIRKSHEIRKRAGTYRMARGFLGKYKNSAKEFICKLCTVPSRFFSNWNLVRHMKSRHGGAGRVRFGDSFFRLSGNEKKKNERKDSRLQHL